MRLVGVGRLVIAGVVCSLAGCGGQTGHTTTSSRDAAVDAATAAEQVSTPPPTPPLPVRRDAGASYCTTPSDAGTGGECAPAGPVDLTTDPRNCGACGNDCDGGACHAGACVALPPDTLATGQSSPVAIAVDATNVYWLNMGTPSGPGGKTGYDYVDGQVMKCAVGGCGNRPTILAEGWPQAGSLPISPEALSVDATNVYWAGGGQVLSCAIAGCGCQPNILGSIGGGVSGVMLASGSVYFTEYENNVVGRCPTNGQAGSSPFATTVGGPLGLTHDATNLFWISSNGDLFECPLAGCGSRPTALITPTAAGSRAVTSDDRNLYWTNGNPGNQGSVMQCAKSNCGATVTVLASGRSSPMGIAVDATDVYWVESQIYRCAIGGCAAPTEVAPTLVVGGPIALDATHIYVVNAAPAASGGYVGQSIVALLK